MTDPSLLYVASDLVAVDKPAEYLVHPAGSDAPDLLTWLQDEQVPAGLTPVHRLDLGTSGVVLFAPLNHVERWNALLAKGAVEKRYQALVFGVARNKGVIRRSLRDARRKKSVDAVTRYRTLESFKKWSLLGVRPETGRKHQIRRHLQGIGHAVVGDERYRQRGKPTVPAFPGRLWLHAESIVIDSIELEAPLPAELVQHLSVLRDRS